MATSKLERRVRAFVPNTHDDLHCLQASYVMVVDALTGISPSLEEAEKATAFVREKPTWPFAMFLDLARRGLPVVDFESFDVALFVKDPQAALMHQNQDEETTRIMLETMDVDAERERAAKCIEDPNVHFIPGVPTFEDINRVHRYGGFVICNVNSKALKNEDGYVGHMVVVDRVTEDEVTLQDPGLPPMADWTVTKSQFEKGWMYPSREMANFYGIFPTLGALERFKSDEEVVSRPE